MNGMLSVGALIKRHIKMRGRTIKDVASDLGRNYKTLTGLLNRDAIDAKLLFELANLLDIDLIWMSQLFDKKRSISSLEQYQMPRMTNEFRKSVENEVSENLDRVIYKNPGNITDAKNELIKIYGQLFYVLDVLLPEDYIIRITVERGKEKYYCIPCQDAGQSVGLRRGRNAFVQIFDGNEMLKKIVAERKEVLI